MKFLLIGCGSVGKRHLRNLIKIGIDKKNIAAVDPRDDRLNEVKELGINSVFTDLDEALHNDFNASIICSPTSMHIEQSNKLMNKNINILMEKPLCSDLKGVEDLIKLKEKNITFMMAYVFRFSPLTKKVKELLDNKEIGQILTQEVSSQNIYQIGIHMKIIELFIWQKKNSEVVQFLINVISWIYFII